MEIEKKYLLDKIPFDLSSFESREIRQAYISPDPVIRLRQDGSRFWLTVKGKGDVSREEFELEIEEGQFINLEKKIETGYVEKTRYAIPLDNGLTAELDVYKNSLHGLITVEVEFESEETLADFSPPAWFGEDISFENEYKNSSLALSQSVASR